MTCPTVKPPVHHDRLRFGLVGAGRLVRASVEDPDRFAAARQDLVTFCFDELLPHLEADERWLVQARLCPKGGLLADAMRAESRAMTAAAFELVAATGPCEAMAATRVLHALLAAHVHHEDLLVEAGVEQPEEDVAGRDRHSA